MIARDRQCGGTGEYLQASVRNRSDLVLRPVSPGRHALMVGSTKLRFKVCPLQIQRLQGRDVKGQPRQKRDIMLMHILPGSMLYPSPNGGRNDPYSM